MKEVIRFSEGGGVRKFAAPSDGSTYGSANTRRASHIEPQRFLLRILFHVIRRFVTDESKLAAFTRRWPCNWRARVFDKSIAPTMLGPFASRKEAVQAEIDYIVAQWILADDNNSRGQRDNG